MHGFTDMVCDGIISITIAILVIFVYKTMSLEVDDRLHAWGMSNIDDLSNIVWSYLLSLITTNLLHEGERYIQASISRTDLLRSV